MLAMKNLQRWHILFGIFIACLLIFLCVRAADKYRLSDWGMSDPQIMLSLLQWEKGGWSANKFLLIPQGYAKVVHLLDEPALRQHAHGICPHSSPKVGPRLRYTHYPAGYLVPYAFLFKLGFREIFFMRFLSIIFSTGALILMYILCSQIASPAVSFIAVFFYALSRAFLGYADSLTNLALDDLFRFAFMLAVVLSTRAAAAGKRKAWLIFAWILEFFLSLSSFDSVFFVYLWLIGWDLLERRRFRWKTYIIFALAPLTAHSLQFLQNVWYLGLKDTILDANSSFLVKTAPKEIPGLLILFFKVSTELFNNLYRPAGLILILFILYAVYIKFLSGKTRDRELPSLGLLTVFFLSSLAYGFILPTGARMSYQIRQIAPATGVLAGAFSWSFFKELRRKAITVYLLVAGIVFIFFWSYFAFSDRKPAYIKTKDDPDILLAQQIKSLPTEYEAVIFDLGAFGEFANPEYVPGYPQISPITEYFIGSKPILCFTEAGGLATDLLYMIERSDYKFSPILIAGNPADLEKVISILREKKAFKRDFSSAPTVIMGKSVLILTDLNFRSFQPAS